MQSLTPEPSLLVSVYIPILVIPCHVGKETENL